MHTHRTMVSTATGASPPRQTSRDIGCSPIRFGDIDETRFLRQLNRSSEDSLSSVQHRPNEVNRFE